MDRTGGRASQSAASTTFVQADRRTFRELVQRLTGPSNEARKSPPAQLPESSDATAKSVGVKKPAFKLHERRQRTKLEIRHGVHVNKGPLFNLNLPATTSRTGDFPSPPPAPGVSPVGTSFSSLTLADGELNVLAASAAGSLARSPSLTPSEEEEKAIAERRFYLHPSPRSRTGFVEPELLTLFPLTSPNSKEP
ncbi:VQ motif-containing protein 31 [Nymphaea thermarum]|nr:VQ motif-containing protein 31 [Nymphaea thermarum]